MRELFQEALREIIEEPVTFVVEIVQFLLLLGIIRFLLPRLVGKNLAERRKRIAAQIENADRADEAYAEAQRQAAAIMAEARAEAQRIREAGRTTAERERRAGLERTAEEVRAIALRAQQSVETEKNRVRSEVSEQLVDLVTLVTRRFIEEALTESERRAVTQKLILARLKEMEGITSQQE
jgi:F-type H+-transporting ATPase subunit b